MLDDSIATLKGVGKVRATKLNALGIFTLRDALNYFPSHIEDRRIKPITQAHDTEMVCICARVLCAPSRLFARKNLTITSVMVSDGTGNVKVSFFNNFYAERNLIEGNEYCFFGKISEKNGKKSLSCSVFEPSDRQKSTNRLVAVYRTGAIPQSFFVSLISQCLANSSNMLEDCLPKDLCEMFYLCRADYAVRNIHFPASEEAYNLARNRLAFEELFLLQLMLAMRKKLLRAASVEPFADVDDSKIISSLPYSLTEAQSRVIEEIKKDLLSPYPMNRLIQGDVGSGKTAVACVALYLCAKNGFQGALMAPTEILAKQHYLSISSQFEKLGIKVGLLVGSMTKKEKKDVYSSLADGNIQIVIGTHALFQESVTFSSLKLVVTDEQHRFGVLQRSSLAAKGDSVHVLIMSATPIPRTLALVIYGDLDVSVIDTLPPGRQTIDTFCINDAIRERMYGFCKKEVALGHKVYIVCPMVSESESIDVAAAESYADNLQKNIFPEMKIGLVHGKMTASDKDLVMNDFAFGDTDILVSTTVIEVGVNVPSATLMIIENAERFGLSQLHQLRGRVGRGLFKSYCILMLGTYDETTIKRMNILTKTNDGFLVSRKDLELRGPGEFFGTRQHGLPPLRVASLLDMDTLKKTSAAVSELLQSDPTLSKKEHALLKERVKNMMQNYEMYSA